MDIESLFDGITLICECEDCGHQFETEQEEPSCPKCGSGDVIVYE